MKRYFLIPALGLLACSAPESKTPAATAEANAKGHELFLVNCAACHHPDRVLVGPALRESMQYWTDTRKLHEYINAPEEYMKKSGDERLKKLWDTYGTPMPAFPKLSQADVDSIAAYIKGAPMRATE